MACTVNKLLFSLHLRDFINDRLKGIKGKNNEVSHHVPKMERIEGQKCDRSECMTQVGQIRQGPSSNKGRPVVKLAEKINRSSLGSFKVNIAMLSWGVKTWGCCLVFFYSKTFHMKAANHCLPVVPFLGSIARFGSEMHIV